MNRKTMLCRLTAGIIIITIVIFVSAGNVYAKENENLPTLIQATTLEEDYRALAKLELAVTPLLLEEDWERAFDTSFPHLCRIEVCMLWSYIFFSSIWFVGPYVFSFAWVTSFRMVFSTSIYLSVLFMNSMIAL